MNEIKALSLILQTPGCLPVLFWGDFGIGKTSGVNQLVEFLGWGGEMFRPAERGEGALGVVPVPSDDRSVLHYPMPDWAARLAADERDSVLFLDEISCTPPALQPALMGLALDGIIAGRRLPARVRRVAVANPIDQAAGGWELAPALANRFVHLTWGCPRADQWCAWLAGQPAGAECVRVDPDAWEAQWGQARALGAAFIRSHPSALQEDVGKALGRTPPSYATPRTWEAALRLLATCRASGCMDLYPTLAQGCLGEGVALGGDGKGKGAWLVWLADNDLPDPEDLLKDPGKFEHDPRRPDRTFATLLAVAEAALATTNGKKLSSDKRGERWNQGWEVLARGLDMKLGKDVVLLPAKMLADNSRAPKVTVGRGARRVAVVLQDFLDFVMTPGQNSP